MKNLHCHPSKVGNSNFTCYNHEQLEKIAKNLNKSGYKIKIVSDSKNLWQNINNAMKERCNKEWCWISQPEIKKIDDEEMHEQTFRPEHPESWNRDPRTWLTNFDIDAVMSQYEDYYSDFRFFGPVPIDFADIYTELTNVDLNKLYSNNIKRIGVVFNLDTHTQSGSHWDALYLDMRNPDKGIVSFYDSYGTTPEDEIIDLMAKFIYQGLNNSEQPIKLEPLYNPIRHQHKNSECGVYSINFIITMLRKNCSKNDFINVCKDIITDDEMNRFTNIYFRDSGRA